METLGDSVSHRCLLTLSGVYVRRARRRCICSDATHKTESMGDDNGREDHVDVG